MFVAQPMSALVEEAKQLPKLAPGPGYWISMEEVWNLDRLYNFSYGLPLFRAGQLVRAVQIVHV